MSHIALNFNSALVAQASTASLWHTKTQKRWALARRTRTPRRPHSPRDGVRLPDIISFMPPPPPS
jgi:hypothetical protein